MNPLTTCSNYFVNLICVLLQLHFCFAAVVVACFLLVRAKNSQWKECVASCVRTLRPFMSLNIKACVDAVLFSFFLFIPFHSPLLFPGSAQESDKGSGPMLARTLTLSALGGYLEAPRSLLLRLLAASPPLSSWLHRLTGISSIERLYSLASVTWISG